MRHVEAEIDSKTVLRIWWAFFWRYIACIIAAVILLLGLNILMGSVLLAAGIELGNISHLETIITGITSLITSIVPIRFMLNKDYGQVRLSLIKRTE